MSVYFSYLNEWIKEREGSLKTKEERINEHLYFEALPPRQLKQ